MHSQNEENIRIQDMAIEQLQTLPMTARANTLLYVYQAGTMGFTFAEMHAQMLHGLLSERPINRGKWQTLDISSSPAHATRERRNVTVIYSVPDSPETLEHDVTPDMPWASIHFAERVSGTPLNPAPSYKIWPHHRGNADRHIADQVFSHTYPERFWPKRANSDEIMQFRSGREAKINCGIRYAYGDLDDVVYQLVDNPHTRQAVLPVWFPEDTGANGYRVPCSLTYHFMSDGNDTISLWYSMRSCDFHRHFRNDVYLASRLLQWVCDQVNKSYGLGGDDGQLRPGTLNMTISNLHLMEGDVNDAKTKAMGTSA